MKPEVSYAVADHCSRQRLGSHDPELLSSVSNTGIQSSAVDKVSMANHSSREMSVRRHEK